MTGKSGAAPFAGPRSCPERLTAVRRGGEGSK
jgi:hypothetical protein